MTMRASCGLCGIEFERQASQLKRAKHIRCSRDCGVRNGIRRCSDCEQVLPMASFGAATGKPGGHGYICLVCSRERGREYGAAHREETNARARKWAQDNPEKHAENVATWRAKNRERDLANSRAWRAANPDASRAAYRKYQLANRGKMAMATRQRRAANVGLARAKEREYYRSNPAIAAASARKRRAAKLGNGGNGVTQQEWLELVAICGGCCIYCWTPCERLEQDHFVPLTRGGQHTADNIVPACRFCNASKSNKLYHEWRPRAA